MSSNKYNECFVYFAPLKAAYLLTFPKTSSYITHILTTTTTQDSELNKNIKFDEDSPLGGKDIYSASKASCEIITHSYLDSFFKRDKINIATKPPSMDQLNILKGAPAA